MTLSGIEPATFRLVAQRYKNFATAWPHIVWCTVWKHMLQGQMWEHSDSTALLTEDYMFFLLLVAWVIPIKRQVFWNVFWKL